MIDGTDIFCDIFVAAPFFELANISKSKSYFCGFGLNKIIYHFSTSLVPHSLDDNNIDEQICPDTPTQPDTNHLNFGSLLSDFYLLQNYFYIFWSGSHRVFTREIFGSVKSVNNIFKGAREQGRHKCLGEKKHCRDNLFLMNESNKPSRK